MTTKNIQNINWALIISIATTLILLPLGYLIADNRVMANQIFINSNRLTMLESKPYISAEAELDALADQIVQTNIAQATIKSQLSTLITLNRDINRKLDKHLENSIPKPAPLK